MSAVVAERIPNPPLPLTPDLIDELIAEAELCALRRLRELTASENERIALKASAEILKYSRQQRRERAEPQAAPARKAEPKPAVAAPNAQVAKVTDRLLNPKPTVGAFRAVPDLAGKTLALGSREAAEATVLPLYYLKGESVKLDAVKFLNLDDELDLRGNPCSSPQHVLKALRAGRADAGFVDERLWDDLVARKAADGLTAVWTSPAFSHCVFTAAKDFDKKRAARFTELMLAMDGKDERTAEILRLEGASKWVAGSSDGFETLVKALRAEKDQKPGGGRP